jgi:N-acetylglucosamine-6-sulfatase
MILRSRHIDWPRRSVALSPWAAAAILAAGCGSGDSTTPAQKQTSGTPTSTSTPAQTVKPNFVVVIVDDLDVASAALMPNINSLLVQHGATFANSFACNPVSAPARATLLTGLHSHNHGVKNNTGAYQVFLANSGSSHIAKSLQSAGYRTSMIGKLMNKYVGEDPIPGWNEWNAVYSDEGSDAYYDYSIRETDGSVTAYGNEGEDYITDVLANRALAFLEQSTADDQRPFFLWLAFNAPHEPAEYALDFRHSFAAEIAPRTPSFNEDDINDKPAYVRAIPLMTDDRIHELDSYYRARLRCTLSVDQAVERIVSLLETTGALENTYIIFTSDNGYLQGHHRYFWGKDAPYEPSIRVPLVFRGPRIPAGRSIDTLVSNVDFAPTIAELAGISLPWTADGRSLVSLLTGSASTLSRTAVLIEHFAPFEGHVPTYSGLRTTSNVFVRYINAELELYDLSNDPDQLENQQYKVAPSVLTEWESRLAAVSECRGSACP